MPFPKVIDFLAELMLDLGGVAGSLGSDNTIDRFKLDTLSIKPLICYESVYSEMNNGAADLIAVITNDGWYAGPPASTSGATGAGYYYVSSSGYVSNYAPLGC